MLSAPVALCAACAHAQVGCLAVNWAWQVTFLVKLARSGPSALHCAAIALFLALITQVVYDDVVLTRWLYNNVHKTAAAFAEAASPKKMKMKER